MKRMTTVLLAMLMLIVMCPTNAFAGETAADKYVENILKTEATS